MKADNAKGLLARLKDSALMRFLRTPRGPVLVAVGIATIAVMLYMACNLHSCSTRGTGSISSSGSLWRTSTADATTDSELSAILSGIEGAGNTSVLVTYDRSGALVGVIVVSEGAADATVAVRLMRAVQTATGAEMDRIQIFPRGE